MLTRKLTHLEAHAIAHRLQQAGEVVAGVVEELMGMEASAAAHSPDREQVGEDSRRVDELSMLIRQLVHALRKAAPDNDLAGRAGDYLKRAGLQGSPLRVEAPDAPPSREQMGERWCFNCGHNAHEGSCADASPSRECGERQECPHGQDDGACGWCYDEKAASAPTLGEQHTDEQAAFESWWNANETWPVAAKNLALLAWTTRANKSQPQAAEPKGLTDKHRTACIAPGCHQWDGTGACTCQRLQARKVLERVATALPVLKAMLTKEGLAGADIADEFLADIRALLSKGE